MSTTNSTEVKPIKLLSTDLDGTLVFDQKISDADVAALRRWRQAGGLLVVNTGRPLSCLQDVLAAHGIQYDYAVLCTGGVLVNQAKEILKIRSLNLDLVQEVVELLEQENPITVFVTTTTEDFLLYDTIRLYTQLFTCFTRGTVADLQGLTITGIPMHLSSAASAQRVERIVAQRWGDQLDAARNQDFVDLVPTGVSKGAGLLQLQEILTAPTGDLAGQELEIYTVGDSWNDISMHQVAHCATAMAGSPKEVLDACQQRTTTSVAALVDSLLS